jgi:conjugal transfer pilus assembly protein TraV|tara:strand:- start:40712 stop:41440 length:729 start_codon:yes stop_codon:yes gene_type:complete
MSRFYHTAALLISSIALSSCASLGTNVSGNFDCKAPAGSCAPTSEIDAAASMGPIEEATSNGKRRSAATAQTARTGERVLKIVFPGFVDRDGNLHDARTVHVVARSPDWKSAVVGHDTSNIAKSLSRAIARQSRSTTPQSSDTQISSGFSVPEHSPEADNDTDPFLKSSYELPSRLVTPFSVREAIAGAKAPAIEGFDWFPPPKNRTPHPVTASSPKTFPSIEAIEAAKKRSAKTRSPQEKK